MNGNTNNHRNKTQKQTINNLVEEKKIGDDDTQVVWVYVGVYEEWRYMHPYFNVVYFTDEWRKRHDQVFVCVCVCLASFSYIIDIFLFSSFSSFDLYNFVSYIILCHQYCCNTASYQGKANYCIIKDYEYLIIISQVTELETERERERERDYFTVYAFTYM